VPTEDGLFLFLNKFFDDIDGFLKNTHDSYIHVSKILMLNAIYHYYEVIGKINILYLLHTILLFMSLITYFPKIEFTVIKIIFHVSYKHACLIQK